MPGTHVRRTGGPRVRVKSCPRCGRGDVYFDLLDKDWVCLQCGHRFNAQGIRGEKRNNKRSA